jgi:adenylate cyclase
MITNNLEIERKYLLQDIPTSIFNHPPMTIDQGWLPGDTIKERIRHAVFENGRVGYVRAIKVGKGISRFEFEEDMTQALFEAMWPFTEGKRTMKQRYRINDGGFLWEIDVFTGPLTGLFLAEVELEDEYVVVTPPTWLAPWIVREVTDDPNYTNAKLAR